MKERDIKDLAWKFELAWEAWQNRQSLNWTERRRGPRRPADATLVFMGLARAVVERHEKILRHGMDALADAIREGELGVEKEQGDD